MRIHRDWLVLAAQALLILGGLLGIACFAYLVS